MLALPLLMWAGTIFYAMAESGYNILQHRKLSTMGALLGKQPSNVVSRSPLTSGDLFLSSGASGVAAGIVAYAKAQLGIPYVWGGPLNGDCNAPDGFDCSGLVRCAVFAATGGRWSLSHYTVTQQAELARWRATGDPQPGDIWYYLVPSDLAKPGHVGIYIGGGKVIHAPTQGQPVQIGDANMYPTTGKFRPARRYTQTDTTPKSGPGRRVVPV